jgi:hypothetical protein
MNSSLKERLKKLSYVAVFVILIWLLNSGLWLAGEIFVLIILAFLIPIKLFMIPLRFFQMRHEFGKPVSVFIIYSVGFFLGAFVFDFITIPSLYVDKFGVLTEGAAVNFRTTNGKSTTYFVTYKYNVNDFPFTREQRVGISTYEKLKLSPSTQIKYLPTYPNLSYLPEEDLLKLDTLFTLLLGCGIMFSLYSIDIENEA